MVDPLFEHAVKLLGRRPHSVRELEMKLVRLCRRRGRKRESPFREEGVAPMVRQLQARGLLDDRDFAAWYREQRQRFRPRSKRLLRSEMAAKGVDEGCISDQLAMYDERDACRKLAQKKARYGEDKLVAYLVRNGFGYGMARSVIREERAEEEDPW